MDERPTKRRGPLTFLWEKFCCLCDACQSNPLATILLFLLGTLLAVLYSSLWALTGVSHSDIRV